MSYETVQLEVQDRIAWLTLNRPDALNALNDVMIDELRELFSALADEENVRVVVVRGAGQAFCSGGDIKYMAQALQTEKPSDLIAGPMQALTEMTMAIQNLPRPVIAMVNGLATGAGFNLALSCDLRVAAESARFSQAFVKIGLVPDAGGTYFLPRIVGVAKATELFFTGAMLSAQEAEQLGLVTRVVPDATLEDEVRKLAKQLAQAPTRALAEIKRLVQRSLQNTLEEQAELEARAQLRIVDQSADFREGVAAFLEKRPPRFRGK